jgi:hypothetical protein
MQLYNKDVGKLIIRFHIFTALIVILGFLGYLYVGIVIGMILFLTSIIGLQLKMPARRKVPAHFPVSFKHVHLPYNRYHRWHEQHHYHHTH